MCYNKKYPVEDKPLTKIIEKIDKTMTKQQEWVYLGDGVYANYDGFGVWLHANDHKDPTDKIYLEPSVFEALMKQKPRDYSPAQARANIRNQHKGRVARMKGLIEWMLQDGVKESLTTKERVELFECRLDFQRILKSWKSKL